MSSSAEFDIQRTKVLWDARHGRHACRAPLWQRPAAPEHEFLGRPLGPAGVRALPVQATGGKRLATLRQVHGTEIHRVGGDRAWPCPSGDGLSTSDSQWILGVQTADCLPILLWDPERRAVAALHAGWRGSAAGIALRGLVHLEHEYGSSPEGLEAVLGPCVGGCCYEVRDDVWKAFRNGPLADVSHFLPVSESRWRIDLARTNAQALIGAGLRPQHLQILTACTRCANDRLYSYRAEGASVGRNWSLLSPNGSAGD